MATNNLILTAADSGRVFPLRGDMGVALNFTPADNKFRVGFMTQDAGTFIIGSGTRMFRALNLTAQSSLSVGGKVGLFIELMYDTDKNEFVVTKNNLVAGEATGGGSGGAGTAPTVEVSQTVTGAPGTAALVENIGTSTALKLKFTVPAGVPGTNATGGGGVAFPSGGTTAQYLGKTGNADGQVGWITLPTTGTGGTGGTAFAPEVLLTQNAQGEITPNKALGNAFAVMTTMALVIKNPEGYEVGETITVAVRQGPTGPWPTDWGQDWAHPDRQPPRFSTQPGGLNKVTAYLTQQIDAGNKGGWMTDVSPVASVVGYGVPAFIARNVTTDVGYYVLRSGVVPAEQCGMTAMRPGQTLKILRNGLGVEAYGGLEGPVNGTGNYLITGALPNGNRAELRTGPGVRSAFDRGVLAFGGDINVTLQDIILSGAREQGVSPDMGNARGISLTGAANVTVKNVRVYDNQNGLLTGTDYTGTLRLFDCEFESNGVGHYGFTHEIYMGEHQQPWYATRTTFKNSVSAHNIKTRSGDAILNQVHCYNSLNGRELDCPNGGQIHATDCRFEHLVTANQNDCVAIGQEGVITTRPREYIFRNCHFVNGKGNGNAASYINNQDTGVTVQCIDCTFEGAKGNGVTDPSIWPGTDVHGMAGPVSVTFTGGPVGPRAPVGYQSVAVTSIAG